LFQLASPDRRPPTPSPSSPRRAKLVGVNNLPGDGLVTVHATPSPRSSPLPLDFHQGAQPNR
jgi:hypothetical protein